LYDLREAIERGKNVPDDQRSLNLAKGYRQAADTTASQNGHDRTLALYRGALNKIESVKTDNDDAKFELEATIRGLSGFLVRNYSVSFVRQFWRSLAGATIAGPVRTRIEQEVGKPER
jgi:hypothetical protein